LEQALEQPAQQQQQSISGAGTQGEGQEEDAASARRYILRSTIIVRINLSLLSVNFQLDLHKERPLPTDRPPVPIGPAVYFAFDRHQAHGIDAVGYVYVSARTFAAFADRLPILHVTLQA
jgi:hypothetical protein